MTKFRRTLLILSFLAAGFLSEPLNGVEKSGGWALQGEFLYFSPSFDDTYYVLVGSEDDGSDNLMPSGRRMNNPIGFEPGFRIEGIYNFCNSSIDLRARWTHIYATSRETLNNLDSPPQLWPIAIIPSQPNVSEPFSGRASSRIGVMYQKGEILFDEEVWRFCLGSLYFREGVEWSYIRYHEVINYAEASGPQEKIQFHAHTKGIGPQIGIIATLEPARFFCWHPRFLSYSLMTTGTLIAANSKSKIFSTNALDVLSKITQQSFWRLVPEWVIRGAVNQSVCLGCVDARLEVGYELTTYFRGTSKLIFTDSESPGLSQNQYSDFYVHGFFLSLGFHF